MFEEIFERRKLNVEKLTAYGFESESDQWVYNTDIKDGEFLLKISISESGSCDTRLTEKESGEEYILYKTNAIGNYVGEIRYAIEIVLRDIAKKCYDSAIFKTKQTEILIEYVKNTYGDELEFLWQKFPDNAVWRRKDNNKWYGAILTVQGTKIGLKTNQIVEIIDLRMNPENKNEILSKENYYPGWHMNKNSWYTIVLDGSVPNDELIGCLNESYELARK
jgi:predicted DNA-binding protein (MmcQ/YjbR family)